MARIDIVIAKLPALIADRADSLKLETAIRYVGDIIFDASQNRGGDKAKALARVLSKPASPEEAQSREAILTLFRDGYLDRYANFTAWRDIALAAGISSDPTQMVPFNQESATSDTPKVVVLTGMLKAPSASVKAAAERPERVKSAEALKLSTPTPRKDEPTRRLKTVIEAASNEATGERVAQAPRESGGLQRARQVAEARDLAKGATASLEITALGGTYRNPVEFAKKFKENAADKLSEMGFPCLVGFVPKISTDERSVEWANPVTADSFRDQGRRLTSGSPSRLAIRAMLELARADNWTSVAVKGTVRLQAFTEATAAELDRLFPVSPGQGTAGRSFHQLPRPSSVGPKRRRLSRVIGMSASLLVLVQMGFGLAYIYSNPQLQTQLGIKSLIDTLPWKHEELLAKARENALEFSQVTLALSTRTGTALAPPQAQFKDTELTNARYLKWTATFKNLLAGVEGHDEKVEARFYDPNGVQIASSAANAFVWPSQKTADLSGVALIPPMTDRPAGTYRVALYSDDKMLTQESFQVNQNLSAEKAAEAAKAAALAKAEQGKRENQARKLATIDERRAKGGPQSTDIGRPPPLLAEAGCELWRGRSSDDDGPVLMEDGTAMVADRTDMLEARFCSDQQGHVTGMVQVSSLKSGYVSSEVEGLRAPNGDFFLHDVRFREYHLASGRACLTDRYTLTPEGADRLVGSAVSKTCHDNAQVDLTRMGPSALPPPAPEARETSETTGAAAPDTVTAAAKPEEHKPDEEARMLAMIDERRAKPLQLRDIQFFNSTKTGTKIDSFSSGYSPSYAGYSPSYPVAATDSFDVSKVLFVGWEVSFENRLYKLEQNHYRVDATYIAPDGHTLGSINDFQTVSSTMKTVTFTGRVGNSRGGAFLPGSYTVNFYLNGQLFGTKKFEVVADAGVPMRLH